jgi:ABC-type spermidine/putrescine transport system permease subunit II
MDLVFAQFVQLEGNWAEIGRIAQNRLEGSVPRSRVVPLVSVAVACGVGTCLGSGCGRARLEGRRWFRCAALVIVAVSVAVAVTAAVAVGMAFRYRPSVTEAVQASPWSCPRGDVAVLVGEGDGDGVDVG